MKVHLSPYNPDWLAQFQAQKATLAEILQDIPITSIEHVGSTSIPGLWAKPVLDIDIIIPLSSLPAVRQALAQAGYTDCGELNVPGRFVFRQPGFGLADAAFGTLAKGDAGADGEMRRNTYAMIEGSQALRNHLDVKRMLTQDAKLREEYAAVKREVAKRDFANIGEYVMTKDDVLFKILRRAGWREEELELLREANRKHRK